MRGVGIVQIGLENSLPALLVVNPPLQMLDRRHFIIYFLRSWATRLERSRSSSSSHPHRATQLSLEREFNARRRSQASTRCFCAVTTACISNKVRRTERRLDYVVDEFMVVAAEGVKATGSPIEVADKAEETG